MGEMKKAVLQRAFGWGLSRTGILTSAVDMVELKTKKEFIVVRNGLNSLASWQYMVSNSYPTELKRTELVDIVPTYCFSQESEVEPPAQAILYLHGGGFFAGGIETHKSFVNMLSQMVHIPVYFPEYRLAPEAQYPKAIEDVVHAYVRLCQKYSPENIVLMGDSAGGNLVLTSMLYMLNKSVPLPAGGVCISPWVDLRGVSENSLESYSYNHGSDIISYKSANRVISAYVKGDPLSKLDDEERSDPLVSPICSDRLSELPPLLITAGSNEILLSQITQFVREANAQNHQPLLHITSNAPHVQPLFMPFGVREATRGMIQIYYWLQQLFPLLKIPSHKEHKFYSEIHHLFSPEHAAPVF